MTSRTRLVSVAHVSNVTGAIAPVEEWIATAVGVRSGLNIAIKGDQNSNYEKFGEVIETLKKRRIYKFILVTTLESKPSNI